MKAKDEVVVVTGAASGVGAATATLFVREGALVVATDISPLDRLTEELRGLAGKLVCVQADLAQSGSAEYIIDAALMEFGRVDILISNAALASSGTVESVSDEEWDIAFAVNFRAAVRLSRAVLPSMKKAGKGVILFTTALGGHYGMPNWTPYVTSKAALIGLVRCLALDYARAGIRVNSVSPGPINTPMMRQSQAAFNVAEHAFAAMMPTGRITEPAEVAEAFLYLASPAAKSITGTTLMLDGGMFAGQFQPRPV